MQCVLWTEHDGCTPSRGGFALDAGGALHAPCEVHLQVAGAQGPALQCHLPAPMPRHAPWPCSPRSDAARELGVQS